MTEEIEILIWNWSGWGVGRSKKEEEENQMTEKKKDSNMKLVRLGSWVVIKNKEIKMTEEIEILIWNWSGWGVGRSKKEEEENQMTEKKDSNMKLVRLGIWVVKKRTQKSNDQKKVEILIWNWSGWGVGHSGWGLGGRCRQVKLFHSLLQIDSFSQTSSWPLFPFNSWGKFWPSQGEGGGWGGGGGGGDRASASAGEAPTSQEELILRSVRRPVFFNILSSVNNSKTMLSSVNNILNPVWLVYILLRPACPLSTININSMCAVSQTLRTFQIYEY